MTSQAHAARQQANPNLILADMQPNQTMARDFASQAHMAGLSPRSVIRDVKNLLHVMAEKQLHDHLATPELPRRLRLALDRRPCVVANRWGARRLFAMFFAPISRLGDAVFC